MEFNDYWIRAAETAIYPKEIGLAYAALGLAGEGGEVANKVKKVFRDQGGKLDEVTISMIASELGDVLWYIAAMCSEIGVSMDTVAERNLAKLAARKSVGTLGGNGDLR